LDDECFTPLLVAFFSELEDVLLVEASGSGVAVEVAGLKGAAVDLQVAGGVGGGDQGGLGGHPGAP